MIKLFFSCIFSAFIGTVLAVEIWRLLVIVGEELSRLQNCSGQILGWYDACVNSNTFVQLDLALLFERLYSLSFGLAAALLFALLFALAFIVSAYVHTAYAAYLQEKQS